jgi:dipeptidyl aminopeptidase/acylaminoacyl peptidase
MRTKRKLKKRSVRADDLCRLKMIASVAVSPDEKSIAYVVQKAADDKKSYYSHVFLADVDSGESHQFTFGKVADRNPVWSPDGKQVAFVSTRDKKNGIYVISSEGGAERKIIEEDGSFADLCWTPDGKSLVYQFRYNDSHVEKDESKRKEAPLYRHITRLMYRFDGEGYVPKDRCHIWKVDINDGRVVRITSGKYDEGMPAVSPDGKLVAFASRRSRNPDFYVDRYELFLVSIDGGRITKVPTPAGPVFYPSFSPDGRKLAYLGYDTPDSKEGPSNLHLWVVGLHGRPRARDIIPDFDRTLENMTLTDSGQPTYALAPQWSQDGRRIFFSADDTGSHHIFAVSAKGGKPVRITGRKCHVKHYSMNGRKKYIAAVVGDIRTPGDIKLFPAIADGDRKAKTITAVNDALFRTLSFPKTEEVWFRAKDRFRLQGWLVMPPNFNSRKKYPAILEIHGGPRCQYGFTFFHEMLFLASKGYIVFYINPRGGGGLGEKFVRAIHANWGSIDYDDCMAAADYLAALPYVNKNRMGVTGGSYGGYMTNWIIGHSNLFRAAVTQRSVVDLTSFMATSDAGYTMHRTFNGYPWTRPELYHERSPLTHARNVKTPLLIIHSENDLRCDIGQAEQLYITLKLMKKKVEFVRFPEESHGLSRQGRPDRRIARLEWIVRWFNRFLK